MTTREPGVNEVLTSRLGFEPRATALLASSPAPIITAGFDVLVQLAIAAIMMSPSFDRAGTVLFAPDKPVTETRLALRRATGVRAAGAARKRTARRMTRSMSTMRV